MQSNRASFPSPFSEVNILLSALLEKVQATLGAQLVGIYIHGSLASGDFDPKRSDIDFVVVTQERLSEGMIEALGIMHSQLLSNGLALVEHLEGAYFPRQSIRRYNPDDATHPALHTGGDFSMDGFGRDWMIQCYTLREQGMILYGDSPDRLIDPISGDDLRAATIDTLLSWWKPMIEDSFRLEDAEYQAYAVLTMCRMSYTLKHGTVISKPFAANWAKENLDAGWQSLIDEAVNWRLGTEMNRLDEVLAFIKDTIDQNTE